MTRSASWLSIGVSLFALAPQSAAQQSEGCPAPTATNVQAVYANGHTFITWDEVPTSGGNGNQFGVDETYIVYEHDEPITSANFGEADPILFNGGFFEIPENSSRFYADLLNPDEAYCVFGKCGPCAFEKRHTGRLWARDSSGTPYKLANGQGLLVLTPTEQRTRYYAVTTIPAGGLENTCVDGDNTTGAVLEDDLDPDPILLTGSNSACGAGVEVYLQYMDPRDWNVTLDAPNRMNCFYGFDDVSNPSGVNRMTKAIQYAYTYEVAYPGGTPPTSAGWPTTVVLHGRGGVKADCSPATEGSILIRPYDYVGTSWFGSARAFDYRTLDILNPTYPERGNDEIVNFTEQRVVRALYDTIRLKQNDPSDKVDTNRVYVRGHSMGGGGTLNFAIHYPSIFAAAHASKAATESGNIEVTTACPPCYAGGEGASNFRPFLWGDPMELECDRVLTSTYLPEFHDPEADQWDEINARYAGRGFNVYQWRSVRENVQGIGLGSCTVAAPFGERLHDEVVPFGVYHSYNDPTVGFCEQAVPLYPMLNEGRRSAAAEYLAAGGHTNQTGTIPEYAHLNSSGQPDGFSLGMPPPLQGNPSNVPFQGHTVVRDETVPGLRLVDPAVEVAPACSTPVSGELLLKQVDWESSWRDIGAVTLPPIDQNSGTVRWQMHFKNHSGQSLTVDITPRRLQQFVPQLDGSGDPLYTAKLEYLNAAGEVVGTVAPTLTGVQRAPGEPALLTIEGVVLGPNAIHRVSIIE